MACRAWRHWNVRRSLENTCMSVLTTQMCTLTIRSKFQNCLFFLHPFFDDANECQMSKCWVRFFCGVGWWFRMNFWLWYENIHKVLNSGMSSVFFTDKKTLHFLWMHRCHNHKPHSYQNMCTHFHNGSHMYAGLQRIAKEIYSEQLKRKELNF